MVITVKHEALVNKQLLTDSLIKKLTFSVVNPFTEETKTFQEFTIDNSGVWIPRAVIPNFYKYIEDGEWEKVTIPFNVTLREYQREIVDNFFAFSENCNGIITAPTGSGKTVMGLYIAHKIGIKTLIVVPTDRIFHQWIERCENFCGFTPSVIRGNICQYDKTITIGMLQTLAIGTRIDKKQLYKKFGLTIYDEVHRIPTEKFSVVVKMFWDKYRIGLSATPTRKDKMHNLFIYHIGKIITTPVSSQIKPVVYMVKYENPDSNADKYVWNGKLNFPRYLNKLSVITDRNKLIAHYIYSAYQGNRKVLMLTDRIKHIDEIMKLLKLTDMDLSKVGVITGEIKEVDKDILLATYGSAGLGLDIPELDFLIFATPRADIRQAIGRVLRTKQNKQTPIVIDIVDTSSEIMKNYAKARFYTYLKLKCNIKEVSSNINQL